MKDSDAIIALLLIALIVSALAIIAVAVTNNPQQTTSNITTPSPTLKAEPESIDWGNLTRGQQDVRLIHIYNISNTTTQPLSMISNCTVGTLTWDSEGTTIENYERRECIFHLAISDSAPAGPFNFTITVTG